MRLVRPRLHEAFFLERQCDVDERGSHIQTEVVGEELVLRVGLEHLLVFGERVDRDLGGHYDFLLRPAIPRCSAP